MIQETETLKKLLIFRETESSLRIFSKAENFLKSWEFSSRVENIPQELKTFFPKQYKNVSASLLSGNLEKEEVYGAKIFDSPGSFCLVL